MNFPQKITVSNLMAIPGALAGGMVADWLGVWNQHGPTLVWSGAGVVWILTLAILMAISIPPAPEDK